APLSSRRTFSASFERTDSTISGTVDHERRRSSTSPPSMSGRPRSRMTRSGCCSVTLLRASAPVSASCTTKPSSSSPARRKRRICTSSSTTRTTGGCCSVIRGGLRLFGVRIIRQENRYCCALIGALAGCLQPATIGTHESLGDPEAEAGARGGGGEAIATEEPFTKLRHLVRREAGAAVVHREHHVVTVPLGADFDRGAARRIFGGVVDDLHEGLLDQHRVDIDERQVGVHVECHFVLGQPPLPALERRVDDVGRLDPFELRLDLVAADPSRVQKILDVV